MSERTLVIVNLVGMFFSLFGMVLLFRFALPYKERTNGEQRLLLQGKDEAAVLIEKRYDRLQGIGLAFALIGTSLQMWVVAVQGKLF